MRTQEKSSVRDLIFVPPKIHVLKSNSQCNGTRKWGLWEVSRSWRWSPHGINVLTKEIPESSYTPLPYEDTARWLSRKQEKGTNKTPNLPALWFGLLSLRTVRNKYLLFKHPSLWYFYYSRPNGTRLQVKYIKEAFSKLWENSRRPQLQWQIPPIYTEARDE